MGAGRFSVVLSLRTASGQAFRRWSELDRCWKEVFAVYCEKCHRELYYKDPDSQGWCFTCGQIVGVDNCKVSFWNLMAVFTMFWPLQV